MKEYFPNISKYSNNHVVGRSNKPKPEHSVRVHVNTIITCISSFCFDNCFKNQGFMTAITILRVISYERKRVFRFGNVTTALHTTL